MKGLEQRRIQHSIGAKVDIVQALVDWSQETIHLDGVLPAELKALLLSISLEEEQGLCCLTALLFDCLFSACIPLFPKIIDYWDLFKGKQALPSGLDHKIP